jgi:hypothetical protein
MSDYRTFKDIRHNKRDVKKLIINKVKMKTEKGDLLDSDPDNPMNMVLTAIQQYKKGKLSKEELIAELSKLSHDYPGFDVNEGLILSFSSNKESF